MTVSVVIPCLNEEWGITALLDAIRLQDAPVHEILIVDNGSTDASEDLVRDYQRKFPEWPLHLLRCAEPGAAAAMNVGIRAATGDVIVRLDGHSLPAQGYVRFALETLQGERVGVVGGSWDTVARTGTLVSRAIAAALTHRLGTGGAAYRHPDMFRESHDVDTVAFGCYQKTLWQKLDGYNERLLINEDYVFNYRARLLGLRVVLDPRMRCKYFARATFGRLSRQYFQYGWRKADMLRVFPGALRLRQMLPAGLVGGLLALAVIGLFAPGVWWVLAAVLGVYAAFLILVAGEMARTNTSRGSWRSVPACAAAFAVLQLSWGAGACVYLLTLGRWPPWKKQKPSADRPMTSRLQD